jgi:hypothetical protein
MCILFLNQIIFYWSSTDKSYKNSAYTLNILVPLIYNTYWDKIVIWDRK